MPKLDRKGPELPPWKGPDMTAGKPSLVMTKSNWGDHRDEVNQVIDFYAGKDTPINMAPMYSISVVDEYGRLTTKCPRFVSRVEVFYSSDDVNFDAHLTGIGIVLMALAGIFGCMLHPFITIISIVGNTPSAIKWMRRVSF